MTWGNLGRLNTQMDCSVLDKFSGDPSFRAGEPPVLSPTVIAIKCEKNDLFATNVKKQQLIIELLINPQTKMVSFVFLSKAAPKCRSFGLAHCLLRRWGKPAENTERCAVIGSVFCHSWGQYVTTKSKGRN